MTMEEFLEVESIKRVRDLYSHYLDAGELRKLVELFTDDAVLDFGPYGSWQGKETFYEKFVEAERPFYARGYFTSYHATTNHVVDLTGPDTAVGRSYLVEFVIEELEKSANPLYWLGMYDDDYRKVGGTWKIARTALQFTWPKRLVGEAFPGPFVPRAPD